MSKYTRQRQGRDFPTPDNYLKNAEMSVEGNYNMLDGLINNAGPFRGDLTDGQTWEEMRNLAPETLPEEKHSILERLREQAKSMEANADRTPVDGHEPPGVWPPERER